ncbi:transcription intermediary factor 1-beta-like [Arapaima gigas]
MAASCASGSTAKRRAGSCSRVAGNEKYRVSAALVEEFPVNDSCSDMRSQDSRPPGAQDGGSRSPPQDPSTCGSPADVSFGDCGVCGAALRPERSPQLLPCLHSLCGSCTPPQGPRESARECPVCKQSYTLLEVIDNPFLKYSASPSGAQEINKCSGCEEFAVSGWCVQCGEALCSVCVSAHQRVRVTRDHTVLPQRFPSDSTPTVFCRTHKEEPVMLFCKSCNQLTCRDCQLTFHRNHSYQFLHEALTSQREQIENLLARLRQQRDTVKQSLLDLDGRLLDLTAMKSRLKDELQETLVRIRYVLMKRSVMLFKDVQELCGSEAERVTERQATLRRLGQRQDHVLSFTEKALATGNHFALLSSKRQIQLQLEDILSQNVLPAASMMDLKFHCDQDFCNRISRFGKIITKEVPFARSDAHASPKQTQNWQFQSQGVSTSKPLGSQSYSSVSIVVPSSPTQCQAEPSQIISTSVRCAPNALQQPCVGSPRATATSGSSLAPAALSHSTQSASSNRISLPSPLLSVQHQTRLKRLKNNKTWSFHNYQPKRPRLAPHPVCPVTPDAFQFPTRESQPSAPSSLAILKSFSSPVRLYPVTLSPIVIASEPPTTGVLNINNDTINTCTVQAITQTLSTQVQNAVPAEPWHMGLAIESVKSLSDTSSCQEQQPLKNQSGYLPVKAPADSPCERAAPAASCGRNPDMDKQSQVGENEPTSTVTETENAFPAEVLETEGLLYEKLQGQERATESANGAPTVTLKPLGQACTEQDPQSITSSRADSKNPSEEELPSAVQAELMADQKLDTENMKVPTSFQELLEGPTSEISSAFCKTLRSGSVDSLRKVVLRDLSFRNWLPQVSVLRLPISPPLPNQPLPQFRLLPTSSTHKVLLQVIDGSHQSVSVNSMGTCKLLDLPASHWVKGKDCVACRTPGELQLCVDCGRGFHSDCHIPPLSSTTCMEWKCLLCWDLSDNDPYSTERERRPSLSLPDQKKCEYLLLALICNPHSTVLFHTVQLSSHYIDIKLIRGRLLRKQSPSYRTPSEFVSDIWVLLDTLLDISKETNLVVKLQEFFQKELSKTFGKTLHPSLLKCPNSRFIGGPEDEGMQRSGKTVKSTEGLEQGNPDVPLEDCCLDGGRGTENDK